MSDESEVTTLSKVGEAHPGQWVALEVISRDANGKPLNVKVLAHATSRLEVREKIRGIHDVYITFTGPVAPVGHGVLYRLHP